MIEGELPQTQRTAEIGEPPHAAEGLEASRGDRERSRRRQRRGRSGADVFRYRLQWADGSDAGKSAYDVPIVAGDVILPRYGRFTGWLRVVDVAPSDKDTYDGVLTIKAE